MTELTSVESAQVDRPGLGNNTADAGWSRIGLTNHLETMPYQSTNETRFLSSLKRLFENDVSGFEVLKRCTNCDFTCTALSLCFNIVDDDYCPNNNSCDNLDHHQRKRCSVYSNDKNYKDMLFCGRKLEYCFKCKNLQLHNHFSHNGIHSQKLNLGGFSPVLCNNVIKTCKSTKQTSECQSVTLASRPRSSPAIFTAQGPETDAPETLDFQMSQPIPPATSSNTCDTINSILASPRDENISFKADLPSPQISETFGNWKGVLNSPVSNRYQHIAELYTNTQKRQLPDPNQHPSSSLAKSARFSYVSETPSSFNELEHTPSQRQETDKHKLFVLQRTDSSSSQPPPVDSHVITRGISVQSDTNEHSKFQDLAEANVAQSNFTITHVKTEEVSESDTASVQENASEPYVRSISAYSVSPSNFHVTQDVDADRVGGKRDSRAHSDHTNSRMMFVRKEYDNKKHYDANKSVQNAAQSFGETVSIEVVNTSSIVDTNANKSNQMSLSYAVESVKVEETDDQSTENSSDLVIDQFYNANSDDGDDIGFHDSNNDNDHINNVQKPPLSPQQDFSLFNGSMICNKKLASWTNKDVVDFLQSTDCKEHAVIFENEDIDGKALDLLDEEKISKLLEDVAASHEPILHIFMFKLKGQIDDCCCSIETVNKLNNLHIYPRISSLVAKSSYLKYFKVNLNKGCPFWPNDNRCALKDCSVDLCSEDEIPAGLKGAKERYSNKQEDQKGKQDQCLHGELESLGDVNSAISEEQLGNFEHWTEHDDTEAKFCDVDDESGADMKYVDLTLNPERYTGYAGKSAAKIWDSIYKENCFVAPNAQTKSYKSLMSQHLDSTHATARILLAINILCEILIVDMCLERRVFFRAISGMHASINIHLSYKFLLSAPPFGKKIWGPNVTEFRRRFDPETTNGQGPRWLKNLYTTYLLVLRAVTKAKPYWEKEDFFTGNKNEDKMVKQTILDIVESASQCPSTFDETLMFSGESQEAKNLKEEFRSHFYNITRIMDCVGCDKCRLWGKLQTQGIGTALKILFSSDNWKQIPVIRGKEFKLSRSEVVALFNALGRFSSSLHSLWKFRQMK
eukprot:gene20460-22476_t